MKSFRDVPSPLARPRTFARGTLVLAMGAGALFASATLLACGSSPEVVKQPDPVKVQWSKGDAEEADERGSGDDTTATGTEVDLDAPKESAKEPANAPEPEPEPAVAAEEPASEAAAEAAAEPTAEEPAAEEAAPAEPAAVPLGKEIRAAVRGKEPKEKPAKKPAAKPKKAPPAEPAPAPAATYSGNDPCQAKSFSIQRVEDACAKNGRSGAKSVMKVAISKALAGGASLKCADCHSNMRTYDLKGDAVDQLKKWLGP